MRTSYFSGNLEKKSTRIALERIFLVSQKFVIYKILNPLKLFWLTVDSSVLLKFQLKVQFNVICHFFCLYCWLSIWIADWNRDKMSLTGLLKTLITWKIILMWLKIHFAFVKSQQITLINSLIRSWTLWKTNWQMKKKNFLRMKILFHV